MGRDSDKISGMSGKTNGTGNGHGPDSGEEKGKIVHFPSLAERKKKIEWRMHAAAGRNLKTDVPFFNFKHIPLFTRVLVISFVLAQVALTLAPEDLKIQVIYTFGFMPGYFTGMVKPFPYGAVISPITHIFIHGGWMHLAFNSVMALSLGMFFEREFGTRRTILFFFLCGLGGALFYFLLNPFSESPVIGASGSISGLFAALIMLLGKRGGLGTRTRNPWPVLIFWLVFMVLMGTMSGISMAWQAHVGGFLAGIGLFALVQKGKF